MNRDINLFFYNVMNIYIIVYVIELVTNFQNNSALFIEE